MVVFFTICLGVSSVALFLQVGPETANSQSAILGSIAASVLGCSAAYIRKVYLDLYNGAFLPTERSEDAAYAQYIYFYTRPLLAIPIGFAVYFFWMSGLNVSVQGKFELSGSGMLLLWAISIIAGFNTGRLIDVTVSLGRRVQGKVERGLD